MPKLREILLQGFENPELKKLFNKFQHPATTAAVATPAAPKGLDVERESKARPPEAKRVPLPVAAVLGDPLIGRAKDFESRLVSTDLPAFKVEVEAFLREIGLNDTDINFYSSLITLDDLQAIRLFGYRRQLIDSLSRITGTQILGVPGADGNLPDLENLVKEKLWSHLSVVRTPQQVIDLLMRDTELGTKQALRDHLGITDRDPNIVNLVRDLRVEHLRRALHTEAMRAGSPLSAAAANLNFPLTDEVVATALRNHVAHNGGAGRNVAQILEAASGDGSLAGTTGAITATLGIAAPSPNLVRDLRVEYLRNQLHREATRAGSPLSAAVANLNSPLTNEVTTALRNHVAHNGDAGRTVAQILEAALGDGSLAGTTAAITTTLGIAAPHANLVRDLRVEHLRRELNALNFPAVNFPALLTAGQLAVFQAHVGGNRTAAQILNTIMNHGSVAAIENALVTDLGLARPLPANLANNLLAMHQLRQRFIALGDPLAAALNLDINQKEIITALVPHIGRNYDQIMAALPRDAALTQNNVQNLFGAAVSNTNTLGILEQLRVTGAGFDRRRHLVTQLGHHPKLAKLFEQGSLTPPASTATLTKIEQAFGKKTPAEVRDLQTLLSTSNNLNILETELSKLVAVPNARALAKEILDVNISKGEYKPPIENQLLADFVRDLHINLSRREIEDLNDYASQWFVNDPAGTVIRFENFTRDLWVRGGSLRDLANGLYDTGTLALAADAERFFIPKTGLPAATPAPQKVQAVTILLINEQTRLREIKEETIAIGAGNYRVPEGPIRSWLINKGVPRFSADGAAGTLNVAIIQAIEAKLLTEPAITYQQFCTYLNTPAVFNTPNNYLPSEPQFNAMRDQARLHSANSAYLQVSVPIKDRITRLQTRMAALTKITAQFGAGVLPRAQKNHLVGLKREHDQLKEKQRSLGENKAQLLNELAEVERVLQLIPTDPNDIQRRFNLAIPHLPAHEKTDIESPFRKDQIVKMRADLVAIKDRLDGANIALNAEMTRVTQKIIEIDGVLARPLEIKAYDAGGVEVKGDRPDGAVRIPLTDDELRMRTGGPFVPDVLVVAAALAAPLGPEGSIKVDYLEPNESKFYQVPNSDCEYKMSLNDTGNRLIAGTIQNAPGRLAWLQDSKKYCEDYLNIAWKQVAAARDMLEQQEEKRRAGMHVPSFVFELFTTSQESRALGVAICCLLSAMPDFGLEKIPILIDGVYPVTKPSDLWDKETGLGKWWSASDIAKMKRVAHTIYGDLDREERTTKGLDAIVSTPRP